MSQLAKSKAAAAAAAGGIWRQENQLQSTLQSLLDITTNPSYPTCLLCGYEYRNQPVVRQHVLKTHLRGKSVDIDVDAKTCSPRAKCKDLASGTFPEDMIVTWAFRGGEEGESSNKNVYSCGKCDYAHQSKIRLGNHVRYLHSGRKKGRPAATTATKNNGANNNAVSSPPPPPPKKDQSSNVIPPTPSSPKKVFKRKRSSTFVENASTVVQENQLRRVLFSLMEPTNKLPLSTKCKICSFTKTKKLVRRHLMEVHLRGKNVHLEETKAGPKGSSLLLPPTKTKRARDDPSCPVVHWILGEEVSVYSCKECDFTHPEESFVRDHSLHLAAEVVLVPEEEESLMMQSSSTTTTSPKRLLSTASSNSSDNAVSAPDSVVSASDGPPKVLYFAKKKVVPPPPPTAASTNGENSRSSTDSSYFAERSLSSPPPPSSSTCSSSHPPSTPTTTTTSAATTNSLLGLRVVKMGEWLSYGRTRDDFWEEREPRIVLQAVKNKEVDMKSGADMLGISYGALYRRYRKSFGKFNSPGGPEESSSNGTSSTPNNKIPPSSSSSISKSLFATQNGGGSNSNHLKKAPPAISISPFYRQLFTKNEVCMTCKLCRRIFPCSSSVRAHLKSYHRALSEEDDFEDEDDDESIVYHCEDVSCTEHERVVDEESNAATITMYFDDVGDDSALNFTYAVQPFLEGSKEDVNNPAAGAAADAAPVVELGVDSY